jgi:hypothetical protein
LDRPKEGVEVELMHGSIVASKREREKGAEKRNERGVSSCRDQRGVEGESAWTNMLEEDSVLFRSCSLPM